MKQQLKKISRSEVLLDISPQLLGRPSSLSSSTDYRNHDAFKTQFKNIVDTYIHRYIVLTAVVHFTDAAKLFRNDMAKRALKPNREPRQSVRTDTQPFLIDLNRTIIYRLLGISLE